MLDFTNAFAWNISIRSYSDFSYREAPVLESNLIKLEAVGLKPYEKEGFIMVFFSQLFQFFQGIFSLNTCQWLSLILEIREILGLKFLLLTLVI